MKNGKPGKTTKPSSKSPPKNPNPQESSSSGDILTAWDRAAGERYHVFMESIEDGVYEVDIHGNFLYFNNSLCKIFGYPREKIQFQSFTKFMDEAHGKKAFENFNRIYRTGKGFTDLIWKIIDKEGKTRIIELSANLIENEKEEKIGFRGIARDITEKFTAREALKKSEKRYRTLLDFAPYPIVVFTLDGRVSYLNPAFTEIFGWTLEELEGKTIPYVPPGLEQETTAAIKRLFEERIILRYETQRLTKGGRVLDVVFRAAVYSETEDEPSGELVILRDITQEKRIARNNEALLRIGMALPEYLDLDELLDYISGEIKLLLGVEGALVILLDEEKGELYFEAAAHDDSDAEKRIKEIRFPAGKGIAGKVIRNGEPVIVLDTSKDSDFFEDVDVQAGFMSKNLLDVPLRSKDRIIGVLCAMNKKAGVFDKTDAEFLSMIGGTVALSIENARFSKEIQKAYRELTRLNRAKDRVINHLSHELKTPLSVLTASMNILSKRLSSLPEETWQPTIERAQRNLERILELQYQVEDIMRGRYYDTHHVLSWMLNECADELESLIAEEVGEGAVVETIRRRMDEIFGPKESASEEIFLDKFVFEIVEEAKPLFPHRQIDLNISLHPVPAIKMPPDVLKKVVMGLIKNAVENTPDEGKIEIFVRKKGKGAELAVRDYGVGITSANKRHIFEGFFTTQETMDYSSKRPFDFNAGGKGADLLRMKIFSERYNFQIKMTSSRCRHIPLDKDICPGRISACGFCKKKEDCHKSGGTTFTVFFSPRD
ncbi:MAG: PAS domain S-box protein [Desulfobacteraceae bacterium]|nr:PAS domain S-box protein [Desulfobacteraceae bacterium]